MSADAELQALRRVADEAYMAVARQEPWSTDDLTNLDAALNDLDVVLAAAQPSITPSGDVPAPAPTAVELREAGQSRPPRDCPAEPHEGDPDV